MMSWTVVQTTFCKSKNEQVLAVKRYAKNINLVDISILCKHLLQNKGCYKFACQLQVQVYGFDALHFTSSA